MWSCVVCNIIIEEISDTIENPKTTFIMNRNLSSNLKNVFYIIKPTNCSEIYIGCTQSLNNSVSLHQRNVKFTKNILNHLYECSNGQFKTMPIYQTDDYSLLPIKGINFIGLIQHYTEPNGIHTHTLTCVKLHLYMVTNIFSHTLTPLNVLENIWAYIHIHA